MPMSTWITFCFAVLAVHHALAKDNSQADPDAVATSPSLPTSPSSAHADSPKRKSVGEIRYERGLQNLRQSIRGMIHNKIIYV